MPSFIIDPNTDRHLSECYRLGVVRPQAYPCVHGGVNVLACHLERRRSGVTNQIHEADVLSALLWWVGGAQTNT